MSAATLPSQKNLAGRLASGGAWVLFGQAMTALTGVATNALLARILTPQELGAYFMAFSITVLAALLGQVGTHQSVVRLVAGELARGAAADVRGMLKGVLLLLGAGLVVVDGLYLSGGGHWLAKHVFHSPFLSGAVTLIAAWIALRAIQTVLSQTCRGFHDLRSAALFGGAISGSVTVVCMGIAWAYGYPLSLGQVLALIVLAISFSVLLGIFTLRRHWRALRSSRVFRLGPVLRTSSPLLVSSAAIAGVAELHLWILGAAGSAQQVALYGAAMRLIQLVGIPLMLVNNLIPPMVAHFFAREELHRVEEVMRTTAVVAALPALAAILLLIAVAGPILTLIYGSYYAHASDALSIMALAQGINVLTGSPGVLLAMSDRQPALMRIGLASGAFGLAVSLLLVHQLGVLGVAFGMATGMVSQNLLMCVYAARRLGVKTYVTVTAIRDLFWRIRSEVARRAQDDGLWLRVEQVVRPIEDAICAALRVPIIECFGDSHTNVFGHLNRLRCARWGYFRATIVRGATAYGLTNPNSRTRALMIFSRWLARIPSSRCVLFMLGEVDVGYRVWVHAEQRGCPPEDLIAETMARYTQFLRTYAGRFSRVVIVSVPLPAAGDFHDDRDMQTLRPNLSASQSQRTLLTLDFNERLRATSTSLGAYFLGMDEQILDPTTGIIRPQFLRKDKIDNHYDWNAFARLLCALLTTVEFRIWFDSRAREMRSGTKTL